MQEHDLSWNDLNLKAAALYYRRRLQDMPLAAMPKDADEATREKIEKIRVKIIENAQKKFLFEVHPLHAPDALIVENGSVKGITFERTEIRNKQLVKTGEKVKINTEMLVSSIGSIPEPLPEMPMQGELYRLKDKVSSHLEGFENVFVVGNAVTGQGNIRASMQHGRAIGKMLSEHLTLTGPDYEELVNLANEKIDAYMIELKAFLSSLPHPDAETCREIRKKIKALQEEKAYQGDYISWVNNRLAERI